MKKTAPKRSLPRKDAYSYAELKKQLEHWHGTALALIEASTSLNLENAALVVSLDQHREMLQRSYEREARLTAALESASREMMMAAGQDIQVEEVSRMPWWERCWRWVFPGRQA